MSPKGGTGSPPIITGLPIGMGISIPITMGAGGKIAGSIPTVLRNTFVAASAAACRPCIRAFIACADAAPPAASASAPELDACVSSSATAPAAPCTTGNAAMAKSMPDMAADMLAIAAKMANGLHTRVISIARAARLPLMNTLALPVMISNTGAVEQHVGATPTSPHRNDGIPLMITVKQPGPIASPKLGNGIGGAGGLKLGGCPCA